MSESPQLSEEELNALPAKVREHIEHLRQENADLRTAKVQIDRQLKDLVRKRNWSKARY